MFLLPQKSNRATNVDYLQHRPQQVAPFLLLEADLGFQPLLNSIFVILLTSLRRIRSRFVDQQENIFLQGPAEWRK